MTDLYFSGAEVPGWRTLLTAQGVRHQALSFVGLSRRVKFARPWLIAQKFGPEIKVFLDSGGHTFNRNGSTVNDDDGPGSGPSRLIERYERFLIEQPDVIAVATEFDALTLPHPVRAAHRARLSELLHDRFLPVWHPEDNLTELHRLADTYGRVAVTQTSLGGRDLVPVLRGLARQGVRLHGAGLTKPDLMRAVAWDSVASTSWISPSQYGDTIVWAGGELKRYPRKYKDEARKRHRTLFTSIGLDAEAIANDDRIELLKLSIWSWTEYMDDLNKQTPAR